jgi:Rrf2 family protein
LDNHGDGSPISPRRLADILDASPTYLAKIATLLAKGGIVRSHRGAQGGITLSRPAAVISLMDIMQACQGKLIGDFCEDTDDVESVCGFHQAMHEVHRATVSILSRWTLAELRRNPLPSTSFTHGTDCWMSHIKMTETEETP